MKAGRFDRRIQVQAATFANDAAGDPVATWANAFKLWARMRETGGSEVEGASQVIRERTTDFTVRASTQSRAIAPERHRIVYKGRVHEITSISESEDGDRHEALLIRTATRPDKQGARGDA